MCFMAHACNITISYSMPHNGTQSCFLHPQMQSFYSKLLTSSCKSQMRLEFPPFHMCSFVTLAACNMLARRHAAYAQHAFPRSDRVRKHDSVLLVVPCMLNHLQHMACLHLFRVKCQLSESSAGGRVRESESLRLPAVSRSD